MKMLLSIIVLSAVFLCLEGRVAMPNPDITYDEFILAVTNCGCPPPPDDVYDAFNAVTSGQFSRHEATMFLAQLIYESAGFHIVEDLFCRITNCTELYKSDMDVAGKVYYGRGYFMITRAKNYLAASEDLGMGKYLLEYPEEVANNKLIAMQVSGWYWKKHVRPRLKIHQNHFGVTTKAINKLECMFYPEIASRRWAIYEKVADILDPDNKAHESGCYN